VIKLTKGDRVSCWVGCHPGTIDGICKGTVISTMKGENNNATSNYLSEICTVKLDNEITIQTESYNLTKIV
jgi:hypothetical protein